MKILAFDTETTGLPEDPDTSIVEAAFALYDTKEDRVMKCFSGLISSETKMTEKASEVNGIKDHHLVDYGLTRRQAFPLIHKAIAESDAVLAFNFSFDKTMVEREFKRDQIPLPMTPWICAMNDVDYPSHVRGKNQGHIAADLGFLNPFPHVAVGDILTMVQICRTLQFSEDHWIHLVAMASSPMITVKAHVNFNTNQKAKDQKFRWNPDKKIWFKEIRECQLADMELTCDFQVTKIIP